MDKIEFTGGQFQFVALSLQSQFWKMDVLSVSRDVATLSTRRGVADNFQAQRRRGTLPQQHSQSSLY